MEHWQRSSSVNVSRIESESGGNKTGAPELGLSTDIADYLWYGICGMGFLLSYLAASRVFDIEAFAELLGRRINAPAVYAREV